MKAASLTAGGTKPVAQADDLLQTKLARLGIPHDTVDHPLIQEAGDLVALLRLGIL
jgi:hypothetical protein